MKRLCMIAMALVVLGARADDATETRLYGARPSSAANVGGNGSAKESSQMPYASDDTESASVQYANPDGTTVVLNALRERVRVSINNGSESESRELAPGEITIYNTQGTLVLTIKATILSTERVLTHQTEPKNRGRRGGFYMVRQLDRNPDIGGPFVRRATIFPGFPRGTVYLVNATGRLLNFESKYYDPFACGPDTGTISGRTGGFAELQIAHCNVLTVRAFVYVGQGIVSTNEYRRREADLNNAVFVFREVLSAPGAFEVVGPYRLIG